MKFKELLVSKTSLPEEVHKLFPASYQALGDICLVKLGYVALKYKHEIGGIILDNFPHFRTVLAIHKILGKLREPKAEVIAGDLRTETTNVEIGCAFKLDVARIMWSKGNHQERKRMIHEAKRGDIILDMFAGIGYFCIPIAKYSKPKKVYAIELNQNAFKYLEENIRLNRLTNIAPILGDCAKILPKLKVKADRIILGLIPSCKEYLPAALKTIKKGGIMHYHGVAHAGKEQELLKDFGKAKVKLLKIIKVKSYAPKINHYVLDVKII